MTPHRQRIRIYLEDTDAQGVVYHANYLKYCERSRTDILTEAGFSLAALREQGWTLMVHELNIKFLRSARLHDEIIVETTARRSSDFRMVFRHAVLLAGEPKPLVTADAHVVAVGADGGLLALPEGLFDGATPG
jgi:acyl-CoA thioester hydrolase